MLEKFISGAVIAAIVVGTPKLYRLGKKFKRGKYIMAFCGAECLRCFLLVLLVPR